MPPRQSIKLENNPVALNHLAHTLGLSPTLSFHDGYSLHDPDVLAFMPRPAHALLAIIPITPTWRATRPAEDAAAPPPYTESGAGEVAPWFKQTVLDGCGSIGFLHCVADTAARDQVIPGSALDRLLRAAVPLGVEDRAELLNSSDGLFEAHQTAARMGDARAPATPAEGNDEWHSGHFVAFVKGRDGHLWEMEGSRAGPRDRGVLAEGEDVLSPRAVELGLGKVMEAERASGGGTLSFSCTVLAPSW